MISRTLLHRTLVPAAVFALTGLPALADPAPTATPTVPVPVPSGILNSQYGQAASEIIQGYLKRQRDMAHNGAHGTVTFFKRFDLQVKTDPLPFLPSGYRQIHLHPGTVINPRGTSLQPGMIVDVSGQSQPDGSLNADLITVVQ